MTKEKMSNSKKNSKLVCTAHECVNPYEDPDVLKCGSCDRKVHYRCTRLPAYQIHVFKSTTKKRTYIYQCQNCVDVPKDLLELIPNRERSQPSLQTTQELERLQQDVKTYTNTIKQQQQKEDHLLKTIEDQHNKYTDLKRKLQSNPAYHTIEYIEDKIETKLEVFKETIVKSIKEECNEALKSYASVTRGTTESNISESLTPSTDRLKTAIKDARKEEEVELKDRVKRSPNIIIHGLPEQTTESIESTDKDKEWVNALINDLHVRVSIKRAIRIGKPLAGKTRPILLALANESEKMNLLGNLQALKDMPIYKGISITEDLTPNQRKEFKELSSEAKQLNETDGSFIWRVRGFSKNGFFLKKLPKLINQRQRQE